MNYLIHSCGKRRWYVNKFLIPSMLKQGIDKKNINVYEDSINYGNLTSTMDSFKELPNFGETWHLQDDVIISSDFKEKTEKYTDGIVCGFCNKYSQENPPGESSPQKMWMSFQCILIPNVVARSCAEWFYTDVVNNKEFRLWVQSRKYDDSIFKIYLQDFWEDIYVYHLAPNIVDHIDYLIGGSTINACRDDKQVRSLYWNEPELVKELERNLQCQYGRQ